MAAPKHEQEELLNGELANLLSAQGLHARPERRESGKRMDVVAEADGLRIVLEAETGFKRKPQAIKDATARLKQGLTTVVFAVCYPEGATVESLANATMTWAMLTKPSEIPGGWAEGGVAQLANAVRQAPNSLSGADIAAQMLSDCLDSVVQHLGTPTRRALAQALDLPPKKKKQGESGDGYFVASKRAMLVIATAMLFHHRVQSHLPADAPIGFDGAWPPASAVACAEEVATINAHHEAWRAILAVDYRPIFETGRAALTAMESNPANALGVRNLAKVVGNIAEMVTGLRHDLLGRIFHRVLDTARYDGSLYTSTAAAVLLTTLALRKQDAEWGDPNAVVGLRICDPACGTGTLLMAAAERIQDLRLASGHTDWVDDEALALHLVEDVLWGYDINLTATHMAASTLGMLSPTTKFGRMNIHRTLLGVHDGAPYLGSLDFLAGQPRLAQWPVVTQQVDYEEAAPPPPPMDLLIMNPPFTRDSLRHDQFSRVEEKAIKDREKAILAGQPHRAAARLHSSGGAFTVLGERMLKPDSGTLALVLPAVVPTSPGNLAIRQYLAGHFHIEIIVSSHDPDRLFFSESTDISEVLLICRRWSGSEPKPPTRVVNLTRNPATPVLSLDMAARIEALANHDSLASFTVQSVPAERIGLGDWYAINFLSPYLVQEYYNLTRMDPPTSFIGMSNLADVGPGGQRIRDSYVNSQLPTLSGRRALWKQDTDATQAMQARTDTYIEPKPNNRHLADRYWGQRSRLLLPNHMRLNTSRVAAVMVDEPTVGSNWTPCRPHDGETATANALCLYLNSTVGLLAILGGRGNRVLSYPSFSIASQRALPVPDFRALRDARDALAARFNELKGEQLQPFPYMNEDPVRKQLDTAIADALGLDAEWIAGIRRHLSEEPSVTNRPYRA